MKVSTFTTYNSEDCCAECWERVKPDEWYRARMVQTSVGGKMHLFDRSPVTLCGRSMKVGGR